MLPACQQMRQVVVFNWVTLVIQAVAIILQIVEPDLVRLTAFGKDQDRRRHASVRFKYAGRQVDHRFQLVIFHQRFAK